MPNTYVALYSNTLPSNTASVTISLSGISGYTDLRLVINGGATVYGGCRMRFNGDTASNYSDTYVLGDGSSPASGRDVSLSYVSAGYPLTTTLTSLHTVDFMNYANTTTNKTILGRSSDAASIALAQVGLWRSTAAITSILLYPASGNFLAGTTFNLYGIANADQGAAKATGGIITEDSQYWYHTFGASGAFIPKQSLTCDILVIAGGGAGGVRQAGGGGAGGLLEFASQSLTSATHNVTVGGGGTGTNNDANKGANGNDSQFAALTLVKGGGGGGSNSNLNGATGGSGGGGASGGTGGSNTSGQGNIGGNGTGNPFFAPGGGGGKGATGAGNVGSVGGAGGVGVSTYSLWGSVAGVGQNVSGTYWFAGGGGGGSGGSNPGGNGGTGGGGAGGADLNDGVNGLANTGGGGGGSGGANPPTYKTAGSGGSGVVIIRYSK